MRSICFLLVLLSLGSSCLRGQNAPIISGTQLPVNIARGGASLSLPLSDKFALEDVMGPIVRFSLTTGIIDVELFPEVAPITVANFRKYVTSGEYDYTFIHRSIENFMFQGGGYWINSVGSVVSINRLPSIKNEYQRPNVPGTLAMAKISGDLNSASSEWFFNVANNTHLNTLPDAYYTVFGRTIAKGLDEAVKISRLPTVNLGGLLANLPLLSGTAAQVDNLVWLQKVQELPLIAASGTGYLTLSASSSKPTLVTAAISGDKLVLRSVGTSLGSALITVKAADRLGRSAQFNFPANVVNPALPVVSLTVRDGEAAESGGNTALVRIQRTGTTAAPLNVALSLAGSTAANGVDFAPLPTVLSIPAGAAYSDLTITPLNGELLKEGMELVNLSLTGSSSYTVAAGTQAQVKLLDDDVPDVTLSVADPVAFEGTPSDTARIRFTRTGPTTAPLSVPFTFSGVAKLGTDFTAPASPLVIPAGSSYADLVVTASEDSVTEGWEALYVKATPGTYGNLRIGEGLVGVGDNDVPTVSQSIADATAAEAGPDSARVRFSRTGSTIAPLTVFFRTGGSAVSGSDYKQLPKAVTIPAGATQADVVITPINDAIKDPAETVTVTLLPIAYYTAMPGSLVVTIQDND